MEDTINSNSPQPEQASAESGLPQPTLPVLEAQLPVVDFKDQQEPEVQCSANICAAGHSWQPVVALAACPGCKGPILVVKMQNCPICNEPPQKFLLRTDHLPQGGAITPMCKGSASLGDVGQIEILRMHAQHEQQNHVEKEMVSKV